VHEVRNWPILLKNSKMELKQKRVRVERRVRSEQRVRVERRVRGERRGSQQHVVHPPLRERNAGE
jgi:hypothetical protein